MATIDCWGTFKFLLYSNNKTQYLTTVKCFCLCTQCVPTSNCVKVLTQPVPFKRYSTPADSSHDRFLTPQVLHALERVGVVVLAELRSAFLSKGGAVAGGLGLHLVSGQPGSNRLSNSHLPRDTPAYACRIRPLKIYLFFFFAVWAVLHVCVCKMNQWGQIFRNGFPLRYARYVCYLFKQQKLQPKPEWWLLVSFPSSMSYTRVTFRALNWLVTQPVVGAALLCKTWLPRSPTVLTTA